MARSALQPSVRRGSPGASRSALAPRVACLAAALVGVAAIAGGSRAATDPAVARPSIRTHGEIVQRGLVFFLRVPRSAGGAAAVGTGHNFDLRQLVQAPRVDFHLGRSQRAVGWSEGFLAPPGKPFNLPGGTLRGDFAVYRMRHAPDGVRVLEADEVAPAPGDRVQILGVPNDSFRDEADVFGRVLEVTPTRLEIELDVPFDLRDWGGAPVLSTRSERVVGILQAFWPQGSLARVSAAPISGVVKALQTPLEQGAGRPFGMFAAEAAARPESGGPAPTEEVDESRLAGTRMKSAPPGPLIPQGPEDGTRVKIEVDFPPAGLRFGHSACGSFVAGRALALQGEMRSFDVVLVIDTSQSTAEPTGSDIDGDGEIGKPYLGPIGAIFMGGSTDPGDSILAAEVAAARQLLRGLDPRSTRVGVVRFAGEPTQGGGFFSRSPPPPAVTMEPLTDDYRRVQHALTEILEHEPEGSTHMAAGVDQAMIELAGLRGAISDPDPKSEKVMLFFTDGQPTLPYGPGFERDNVRAVLRAASRARRARIRIHSFAIGPDALAGPMATVEMAARTDGYFTPVRHPGDLVSVVEQVNFANLELVQLRNLTTKQEAKPFRITPDGSWAGLMRLAPGANRLEVLARAADGTESHRTIDVQYDPESKDPEVPEKLVVARNRLLEDCLRDVKQVRMTTEEERAEQVRKQLMVEIERERAAARDRADAQRKELELGVEDDDEGSKP